MPGAFIVFLSALKKLFIHNKYQGIKSFTYFLPSPPPRKTGYQEKEFDQIMGHLTKQGFDILDVKMQSLNRDTSSGIWILCLLGAKTKEAFESTIDVDYQDISNKIQGHSHIKLDPLIEHDC